MQTRLSGHRTEFQPTDRRGEDRGVVYGARERRPPDIDACVDACLLAYRSCMALIPHCLSLGGEHADARHIGMLMACADLCRTSAQFLLLADEHHGLTCGVCAQVSQACADDCARFQDDEMMQDCAEACRQCAEACREMASTMDAV